jgi:hypothetical protein
MSKAKEQLKKREEEKQNRPLDPLLTHGLRRGMRGQMFNLLHLEPPFLMKTTARKKMKPR